MSASGRVQSFTWLIFTPDERLLSAGQWQLKGHKTQRLRGHIREKRGGQRAAFLNMMSS